MRSPTDDTRAGILVLAKAFPPVLGGVETYSAKVVEEYASRGERVTVVTQIPGPAETRAGIGPLGNVTIINVGAGSQPVVMAKMVLAVHRLLRKTRFRFVHATTWRPALVTWLANRRLSVCVTVHGREIINGSPVVRWLCRRVLSKADAGVTVSHATMDLLDSVVPPDSRHGRWAVAWNGITVEPQPRTAQLATAATVRMFTVCRLVPRKNILRVVQALATLKAHGYENFHLRIAGDGPMRQPIEAAVRDGDMAKHVDVLGRVSDEQLADEYVSNDVFVHPQSHVGDGNDFEGFGLVIADAMAFGQVVVVGKSGGPSDFVEHEKNGLLVDGDDDAAVVETLRRVLDHEVDLDSISGRASSFAHSELSWPRHVDTIFETLDR